jgi:hypothetical protein
MPWAWTATVSRIGGRQSCGARSDNASMPRSSRDHLMRTVAIGLVHHEDVAYLENPGLGSLDAVAHSGSQQDERGIRLAGHLDL